MPQRETILYCAAAACVTAASLGCKRRAGVPPQKEVDTAAARAPQHEPGEIVAGVRLDLRAEDEYVVGDPIPVSIFAENHTDEEMVLSACYVLSGSYRGRFSLEGTDAFLCHPAPPGAPIHYDYQTAKYLLCVLPPRRSKMVMSIDLRDVPAQSPGRSQEYILRKPGTHTLRFNYDGGVGELLLQPMAEAQGKEIRELEERRFRSRLSSNAVTIRIVDEQTRGEAARSVSDDRPEVRDGIVRGSRGLALDLLAKDTYAPGGPVSVTIVARNRTDREIVLSTFGLLGDCSGSNAIKVGDPDGVLYSGRRTPWPRIVEEAERFLVVIPPLETKKIAEKDLLDSSGHNGRMPVENFLKKAGSYRLTFCYNGLGAAPCPGSSREREQRGIPAVFTGRYMHAVWSRPVTITITDR